MTRAVASVLEYKKIVDTCDEYGIKYTFSTDAPALQVTSLAEELMLLLESGAATFDQVRRALAVAEKYSFLSKCNEKQK